MKVKFPVSFGKVDGHFRIYNCPNLKYLTGCPEEVDVFSVESCKSLKSLQGVPLKSNHGIRISNFLNSKALDPIRSIVISNVELRSDWIDSHLSIEDFIRKNRGRIKGSKFGI